jgi:hypothetical protein
MWALLLEIGLAAILVFIAWRVWPKDAPKEKHHDD